MAVKKGRLVKWSLSAIHEPISRDHSDAACQGKWGAIVGSMDRIRIVQEKSVSCSEASSAI